MPHLEKEHKCKCTTPWILGIVIGIAIATASCLVYFLVLNEGCIGSGCEALVAKSVNFNQSDRETLITNSPVGVRTNETTNTGVGDAVLVDETEECLDDCQENGGVYVDDQGYGVYIEPGDPDDLCGEYCEYMAPYYGCDESYPACIETCDTTNAEITSDEERNLCHNLCARNYCPDAEE